MKIKKLSQIFILILIQHLLLLSSCREPTTKSHLNQTSKDGDKASQSKACEIPTTTSLQLTQTQETNLSAAAKKFFKQNNPNPPSFKIKKNSSLTAIKDQGDKLGLQNNPTLESIVIKQSISNIDICQSEIIYFKSQSTEGKVGDFTLLDEKLATEAAKQIIWPNIEKTLQTVQNELNTGTYTWYQQNPLEKENIHSFDKCVRIRAANGQTPLLEPFWDVVMQTGNEVIHTIANHEQVYTNRHGNKVVEKMSFHSFDANAKISILEQVSPSLEYKIKSYTLTGISDSGYLCSENFVTDVEKQPSPTFRFTRENHFLGLEHTTVFANATIHKKWFESLPTAVKLMSKQQILLNILIPPDKDDPSYISFSHNEAKFLPATAKSRPSIHIAPGDSKNLKNLQLDPDVISHEMGHAVIYERVTSTSGESLVLHEGLADYFVMARTGDNCLGNTICPTTSRTCLHTPKCLRSADNNLSYTKDLPDLPHARSQLISALMWDIGKSIGQQQGAILAAGSLFFLRSTSGIQDFISGLVLANKEFFAQAYKCQIENALVKRGFEKQLSSATEQSTIDTSTFPKQCTSSAK